ncbi:hypothetical protein PHYSODRAFT_336544 [Phytophthora sojae]|uniref:Uncharacterized protein n=1 Tax=Phytophthora sojae (strain P6497) TaxID=1094619 RepID=G4ZYP4_PHYSP|nr:hypothetical protein PHYSODRAFT_336544 [Phytophthora sojae]EGZ12077.1 hypothetical protein PHYSODRAFT_336544 [Phytophthora sojae]|eukprot:XP_009532410.1 hypothetical protein PHYSODRAFT_336544 [Phytophthora sojae]
MLPDPDTDATLDNCTVDTLPDPSVDATLDNCTVGTLPDPTWTPCSTTALSAYCRTPLLDDSTLGRLAARLPLDNDSEGLLTKPNGGGTLDDRTHGMLADPAADVMLADLPADVMLVDGKADLVSAPCSLDCTDGMVRILLRSARWATAAADRDANGKLDSVGRHTGP